MSLIRWDPLGNVDTLFNRLMPRGFARWPQVALEGDGGTKLEWLPSADVSETDKEYVIRAELPAVKKEDVQVILDQGMLTIKGERVFSLHNEVRGGSGTWGNRAGPRR